MRLSRKYFKYAKKLIPGGVNSPVRAFRAVGGTPIFVAQGKGAYFWDVDGKRYLDFCMSWGPLIFGHADPGIVGAIRRQVKFGTSYGAPTQNEVELASLIQNAFPSMERARLVSSGTEAVMSAVRLARGATGRKKIVKIDGGYHGHVDSLLIQAGSGALTFGIPDSPGVPDELAKLTFSVPYNDIGALERLFRKEGRRVACFILEPVPANMGVVLPAKDYLEKVRALTKKYGVLLIFDEVITGFRIAFGGAQEMYGVRPDLTCLGKVLGGGLPIGAFGGRRDLLNHLAPDGEVYQAGTLAGNPLATAAGMETLKRLQNKKVYRALGRKSERFFRVLETRIRKKSLPVTLNRIGSCFTLFFTKGPVNDFKSAERADTKKYARFFHALLRRGIYFAPSQFEANFISTAHSPSNLKQAAVTIARTLNETF